MSSKLFDRSRIIKINKDESNRDTHVNDNFWFDEITEESFYNDDYLNKTKQPELKIIQNPNYYFLEPKDKSLDIKKSDILNIPRYSSIDVIPYDESSRSKLPEDIINMRRRSQVIQNNQIDSMLKKINNISSDYFNYDDDDTLQNFSFSPDNELIDSALIKSVKQKIINEHENESSRLTSIKDRLRNTENELKKVNDLNIKNEYTSFKTNDISDIVKNLKNEILNELRKDISSTNSKSGKFVYNPSNSREKDVVLELTKIKNEKQKEKENNKKQKSVIELTREQLYSFEKDNKFKFNGNKSDLKEEIFKKVMNEPFKELKNNSTINKEEVDNSVALSNTEIISADKTEEFKSFPLGEDFKNNVKEQEKKFSIRDEFKKPEDLIDEKSVDLTNMFDLTPEKK